MTLSSVHRFIRANTEKEARGTLTVARKQCKQHRTAETSHHVFSVGFLLALCSIVNVWREAL